MRSLLFAAIAVDVAVLVGALVMRWRQARRRRLANPATIARLEREVLDGAPPALPLEEDTR